MNSVPPFTFTRRTLLGTTLAAAAASVLESGIGHQVPPAHAQGAHPRLFFTDAGLLRTQAGLDQTADQIYQLIKADADALLGTPVQTYSVPDGRLLPVSRDVLRRVLSLGVTWLVSDDDQYFQRLRSEVQAVLAFPDWNENGHFLDTAEMCQAMAIAYDWGYASWDDAERAGLEQAIINHALRPGLAFHRGEGVVLPGYPGITDWPTATNNWNIVCNGGLIVGALAIRDIEPELADEVIRLGVAAMAPAIEEYAPDGGYPEGLGYWQYATKYLVAAIATLESATGDSQGLADYDGVDETGLFPVHLTGPMDITYNYYDSGSNPIMPSENLWLGQRFNIPASMWWGVRGATNFAVAWDRSPLALLWYVPALSVSPVDSRLELDAQFARPAVSIMRSGWQSTLATFVGCKGGDNYTNHSNLDQGSFVLDSDGVRWAVDLGAGDYAWPGYFDRSTGGRRWTYFRMRAESHNTMVFGANPAEDQVVRSTGVIERQASSPTDALTIFNLSDAHPLLAAWRRGYHLLDGRRELVIRDEYHLDEAAVAWWFLHTQSRITISSDGRQATLDLGGRTAQARLVSPADATFVDAAAKPLWTSPNPPQQAGEGALRRLAVRLPAASQGEVTVRVRSIAPGGPETGTQDVPALDAWTVGPATVGQLREVTINGTTVPAFSPDNFWYEMSMPADHPSGKLKVKAKALRGGRVKVSEPQSLPGVLTITVDEPHHATGQYRVLLTAPGAGVPTVADVEFTEAVVASSHDGNLPANTLDGSLQTRWSASGDGEWIAYDLGSDGPISELQIAWFNGHQRYSMFDIQVAADGANDWTTVYQGQSSGTSQGLEVFSFAQVTGRYVRIVGHGNSANQWNSINELMVTGRSVAMPPRAAQLASVAVEVPDRMELGATAEVVVSGQLSDATAADLSQAQLEFISSDPAVLAVDADGVLQALSAGTATITVVVTTPDRRMDWASATVTVASGAVVLNASADTYVHDGSPARNYGYSGTLTIKSAEPGMNRIGYVTFRPDAIADATSVSLALTGRMVDSRGEQMRVDLALADAEFSEYQMTWQDRPGHGPVIGSVVFDREEKAASVDLTEALLPLVQAGQPVVVALLQELAPGEVGLSVLVSTKESSHPAQLTISRS